MSLLRDIRSAQNVLSDLSARGPREPSLAPAASVEISAFLNSLATAWKSGEVRPTDSRHKQPERWWRTRTDPFADAWPVVEGRLIAEPMATAKELLGRLATIVPDVDAGKVHLRTLHRRIKVWRAEKAKDLILGQLRKPSTAFPEARGIGA